MSYSYQSDWFYVGMEGGNVHIVQKDQFEISGYDISWNKVISEGSVSYLTRVWGQGRGCGVVLMVDLFCFRAQRNRPGDVIGMQEHPLDPSKVCYRLFALFY